MSNPTLADVLERLDALTERLNAGPTRYLSIDSAARYADVSDDTIRRALSRGDLTALRPARGRVVIDRLEIDAWLRGTAGTSLRKGRGIRARRPR